MSNGLTPFAGGGYRAYGYRYGYRHSRERPQARIDRAWRLQLRRWRLHGPATITTPGKPARFLSPSLTEHFRQVDRHGKVFGPRLQLTGERWMYLDRDVLIAQDPQGKPHSLKTNTRIRVVERQPEDPHSAACRALTAQWRQTRSDRSA